MSSKATARRSGHGTFRCSGLGTSRAKRIGALVGMSITLLATGCSDPGPGNPASPDTGAGTATTTDPVFEEVARRVGLGFEHFVGATGSYFLPEIMGSGVALFDYDADGDLDVYLPQGVVIHTTWG